MALATLTTKGQVYHSKSDMGFFEVKYECQKRLFRTQLQNGLDYSAKQCKKVIFLGKQVDHETSARAAYY